MKQTTDPRPATTAASSEAKLPVSPGLTDLGDRVSFMEVEVAKVKGNLLIPDPQRFQGAAMTARSLQQPVVLEGDRVL
jgi:hypothetical protein